MAFPHADQISLRAGDTVVTTAEIEGVAVVSEGKVILANGFNWLRYRVRFANGTEVGDLDQRNIAPVGKTAKRLARANKRKS